MKLIIATIVLILSANITLAESSATKIYLSRSGGSLNTQEIQTKQNKYNQQNLPARAQLNLNKLEQSKSKIINLQPLSRTGGSSMAISVPVSK